MKKVLTTLDTRSDMKKAVDNVLTDLPHHLELVKIQAQIAKHQYYSLIEEGFCDEQAMQIITSQPSWK